MKTIWKYVIPITDRIELMMPFGAEILDVQIQYDTPTLWTLVDDDNNIQKRKFLMYGTGHKVNIDIKQKYIKTFQIKGGDLVFHLFEIIQ